MSHTVIQLPTLSPGQQMSLSCHRFGPEGGQKVYIQAGLHADEHPGLLMAQHLIRHLAQLDQEQRLRAEFIVVPFANPLGLNQRVFGHVNGRCDLGTGQNFNRGMAINRNQFGASLAAELLQSNQPPDSFFRHRLQSLVAQRDVQQPIEVLHKTLLSLSIDAHYVFDLHCDDVALPHLFYGDHQREDGQLLARSLGFDVCLEEDVRGTVAFDATHTQPWVLMQQHLPADTLKQPCFAATIELRGQADVSTELAEKDARGLLRFCAEKGLIREAPKQAEAPSSPLTIAVDQVKMIEAEANGIVTYHCQLGDLVKAGDRIAELVLLDRPEATAIPVLAPCDGLVFSQTGHFYVSPGHVIAMLATQEQQLEPGQQLAF